MEKFCYLLQRELLHHSHCLFEQFVIFLLQFDTMLLGDAITAFLEMLDLLTGVVQLRAELSNECVLFVDVVVQGLVFGDEFKVPKMGCVEERCLCGLFVLGEYSQQVR